MIRSISEVIESFRTALKYSSSKLSNFSLYSNTYALYRSIASVITQHESELESIKDAFFISTCSGGDLDRRAADFNLFRKQGTISTGYVLIERSTLNAGLEIPSGTILTNASSSIQVETIEKLPASSLNEQSIQIRSLSLSTDSNLPAGTSLYSNLFPSFKFTVGRYRNPLTLTTQGDLTGGRSVESDYDFRIRIQYFLTSLSKGTSQALTQSIFSIPGITKVFIQENKPITGYLTIYVDSNSIDILRRVKVVVENNKAAGVAYVIKPLKKVDLTVAVEIEVNNYANLQISTTVENVRSSIFGYLDSLDVNSTITPESIAGAALRVASVKNTKVITPNSDVILSPEEVINVSNVLVSTIISR